MFEVAVHIIISLLAHHHHRLLQIFCTVVSSPREHLDKKKNHLVGASGVESSSAAAVGHGVRRERWCRASDVRSVLRSLPSLLYCCCCAAVPHLSCVRGIYHLSNQPEIEVVSEVLILNASCDWWEEPRVWTADILATSHQALVDRDWLFPAIRTQIRILHHSTRPIRRRPHPYGMYHHLPYPRSPHSQAREPWRRFHPWFPEKLRRTCRSSFRQQQTTAKQV